MKTLRLNQWNFTVHYHQFHADFRGWIKRQIEEGHTVMISTEASDISTKQLRRILKGLPEDKVKCKGPKSPLSYVG